MVGGARVCHDELHAPPGKLALYSVASGWHLLGEVIRRLTDRPLSEHLESEIFAPLGSVIVTSAGAEMTGLVGLGHFPVIGTPPPVT